jgi:hypothetical protein
MTLLELVASFKARTWTSSFLRSGSRRDFLRAFWIAPL